MDSGKPSAHENQLCLLEGLGKQKQADSSQKKGIGSAKFPKGIEVEDQNPKWKGGESNAEPSRDCGQPW
jgi:hypothetical protein